MNIEKAPGTRPHMQERHNEGATLPERRAHSAQANPNLIKSMHNSNRFQPLDEEYIQESWRGSDTVRDGLMLDALNSRGIKLRDQVALTPEILSILNKHDPDKDKKS